MEITTKTPAQCTGQDIDELAHLAGIGFGTGDTPAIRQDSIAHICAAKQIQFAHDNQQLVGFAMTRSCLWRQGA